MAFDFPSTPSVGDLFQDSSSGAVYRWNGYAWVGGVAQLPGVYQPLLGVTDGSNAPAGQIGEVISVAVASPGVTLSNSVVANVGSIALTAGDWDVGGEVWVSTGTGAATALQSAISNVSATLPLQGIGTARVIANWPVTASTINAFALRPARVSLAAGATYYLVAIANFPSGTTTAYGNIIARRVR
jgi:hypothetical protein